MSVIGVGWHQHVSPIRAHSSRRLLVAPFFEKRLQFGDDFQILGPACGTFELDEPLQGHEAALNPETAGLRGKWQQLLVSSAACHFA